MSFDIVKNFHIRIYDLLNNNAVIRNNIEKIYLSVPQNAKYPFLLISLTNIENLSKISQSIYQIDFEITAFIKGKSQSVLISIASLIINNLIVENFAIEGYVLGGLKAKKISFHHSQDLITSKLIIHYTALIKQDQPR